MRSKTKVLGAAIVALVAGLVWWLMRPQPAQEVEAAPVEEAIPRDRLARKQAQRDEAPQTDPVEVLGVVRDTAGVGVPGAVVLLTPSFESSMGRSGERPQPVHVRTDAGGGFSIVSVPAGRYTLSASARGFLPAAHRALRVASGRAPPSVTIVLAAGGFLVSGTIEDVSGRPDAAPRSTTRRGRSRSVGWTRVPTRSKSPRREGSRTPRSRSNRDKPPMSTWSSSRLAPSPGPRSIPPASRCRGSACSS